MPGAEEDLLTRAIGKRVAVVVSMIVCVWNDEKRMLTRKKAVKSRLG